MKTLPIALGLSIIFALAGCSSGSSSGPSTGTSTPPSTPPTTAAPVATGAAGIAAAKAQIKTNWATFFNSATPHSTAVKLLQNGANLGPAVKFAARLAKKEKLKEAAKVTQIGFPTPTTATIIYNLYGNKKGTETGTPLLANSNGQAVLDGGVWKVAQITFCTLVDLGAAGKKVPGC